MNGTKFLLGLLVTGTLAFALRPARASDPVAPEWQVPGVTKIAVELATVEDAEPDGPLPAADRFVASLTADGTLHFGPAERYIAGDGDAGAGPLSLSNGAVTQRTLQAYAGALRSILRRPGMRAGDGTSPLRLLMRADHRRPWVEALWLLEAAAAPDVGVTRLQFAVQQAGATPDTKWRLPYDFPPGPGADGPPLRESFVRLDLDEGADGRGRLVVREAFDSAGISVRRKLAEFVLSPDEPLDVDALRDALHAFHALGTEEPGPAVLVATLNLTSRGVHRWTFGDALPILAGLRDLGAVTYFQSAPAVSLPGLGVALHAGARSPFASPPERITPRSRRWEKSVDEALRWLAAHQGEDGGWRAGLATWGKDDDSVPREHDVGVTGLALLAFLGAGHASRGEHPYVETVRGGLAYLQRAQDAEGCVGPRQGHRWIYDHGAATWALVEAYGLTQDPALRLPTQKALDFIRTCRNPYVAYRYGVRPGDNDTSVSGWMLMPLALARTVNVESRSHGQEPPLVLDEEAFDGVHAWLEKITDPDYGRAGYIHRGGGSARPQALIDRFPGDKSEAMTGVGITLRVAMGEDPTRNRALVRGLALLRGLPPTWNPKDGSIDMYYWYWGALATWQAGRIAWKAWADALNRAIVPNQRKDTTYDAYRGSWDPIGPWGEAGGRVYSTALLALTLETPTRYARKFER